MIVGGTSDLRRWIPLHECRINLNTSNQRIRQQLPYMRSQLQQPVIFLLFKNVLWKREQIRGDSRVLNVHQKHASATVAREPRSVLQRRMRVRREIRWEEDVSEWKHLPKHYH